jgi:hypothetical protein
MDKNPRRGDLLALRRIAKKVNGAKKILNDVERQLNDQ